MSPLRPHPKSLSQDWERDFERFFSPSPNIGEACPELVEGGVWDESNTGICKRDMLPYSSSNCMVRSQIEGVQQFMVWREMPMSVRRVQGLGIRRWQGELPIVHLT
jgi:hypothetical protein